MLQDGAVPPPQLWAVGLAENSIRILVSSENSLLSRDRLKLLVG